MILNVVIEEQIYPVDVPAEIVADGEEFFGKLDRDMDKGWQMSRDWVDNPDVEQRCQIVGDKMLTAMRRLHTLACAGHQGNTDRYSW
jgi:hypothetical protein